MKSYDWFKKHAARLDQAVSEWPQWLKDAGSTTFGKGNASSCTQATYRTVESARMVEKLRYLAALPELQRGDAILSFLGDCANGMEHLRKCELTKCEDRAHHG